MIHLTTAQFAWGALFGYGATCALECLHDRFYGRAVAFAVGAAGIIALARWLP